MAALRVSWFADLSLRYDDFLEQDLLGYRPAGARPTSKPSKSRLDLNPSGH
ncbi:hypothetical protein thsrh120_56460 [Rhizobium sp. No.120]